VQANRNVIAFGLGLALAGCSASMPATVPGPGSDGSGALRPNRVCPVVGKTYARGTSSATFRGATVLVGSTAYLQWKVVFTKQQSSFAPVGFDPKLSKCGSPGDKPLGKVRESGGSTKSTCTNGVCRVEVTYGLEYTPPSTLPGNKPWQYDLITMFPSKPKPPFGPLPGVRVEIKLSP